MSRNRFTKEQRDLSPLRELLLPIAAFAAVLLLFLPGLASVDHTAKEAARQGLEDAIRRSAVHCYATEGSYPASLSYLEDHYGIQVDDSRYLVDYEAFASNLMPSITVITR